MKAAGAFVENYAALQHIAVEFCQIYISPQKITSSIPYRLFDDGSTV
jgi:hypothetical protein